MSATMSPRAARLASDAATIDANLRAHFRAASSEEVDAGMAWYYMARCHAHAVAFIACRPMEYGAGIIASFSPLTGWALNLRRANEFARTGRAAAFGAHNRMATLVMELGIDGVTGPKVEPFARAMVGDLCQVPCDSWMNFAAWYGPDSAAAADARRTRKVRVKVPALTDARRRIMESTCRAIAEESGIAPAQVQAIIWVRVRGSAD
jgi:hypothetical protein